MSKILIIAIDAGQAGGISSILFDTETNQCSAVIAEPMPKGIYLINEYIKWLLIKDKQSIVFIEKLSMFQSDTDAQANPGKKFRLQQMHNHYSELIACLKLQGLKYYEVMPRSWQKRLGLVSDVIKDKKGRKNLYKAFAQHNFKNIKVTLPIADSLCILYYGMLQISNNKKEYLV